MSARGPKTDQQRIERIAAMRADGMTMQEIADEFGVSRQRVNQLMKRHMNDDPKKLHDAQVNYLHNLKIASKNSDTNYIARRSVETESGCWEWTGARFIAGYGKLGKKGHQYAHRFAYAAYNGPIPEGLHVRHTCDNPCCVNPEHLLVGTAADNMRDRDERGRHGMKGRAHPNRFLTEQQVREIKAKHREGASTVAIGRAYGVNPGTVWSIVNNKTYINKEN